MKIFNDDGSMSKGFSMMFKSLVGMLGFEPQQAADAANGFKIATEKAIKDFDARLKRMEEMLARIEARQIETTSQEETF